MNIHKLFGKDAHRVVALCDSNSFSFLCTVAKFHHIRITPRSDGWNIYQKGVHYTLSTKSLDRDGIYARLKKL